MKINFVFPVLLVAILHLSGSCIYANVESSGSDNPFAERKLFTRSEIYNLAPVYLTGNIVSSRPALIDVDADGDFDMLVFKDGNIEYYKNIGSLEKPEFVLENKNYDHYEVTPFISEGLPLPIFFADSDGDGDLDMFAVKDKGYNTESKKNEYRVLYAENAFDIDTGTLITIILILVIVLLVLMILR